MLGAYIYGENIERNSNSSSGSLEYIKRSLKQNASSPISPLSPETPNCGYIDLAMHNDVNNSHEQLYQSICDMERSNESQSIQDSITMYENESRIDSKLCHLIGAHDYVDTEEDVKQVNVKEEQEKTPHSKQKGNKEQKLEGKASNVAVIAQKPPISKRGASRRSYSGYSYENMISKNCNAIGGGGAYRKVDNPYLGPYLLKKAQNIILSGDNPKSAFELLNRAKKSFESCHFHKPNLDYVMCLHILASMHCSAGMHREAIPLLEHAIEIPSIELGQNHALAKFVGCMQLGDIYAMMDQIEKAIDLYKCGLQIQKEALGDKDTRFGETCRYVAEAYVQTFEFDEAEQLCKMALDIHKVNGYPPSIEEASNRKLMGLICDSKGNYEAALEHYLVASMAMRCNGQESDIAVVDCNIGDAYLSLARYDEAICTYKKAIAAFTSSKGENHPTVASVFVRLGELYIKVGKFGESKSYSERALEIYSKPPPNGTDVEDIANGLTDLATIYESMNELDEALNLLHKALELHSDEAESRSKIAGIEAQMGVLYFMLGNYTDSYNYLKSSVLNFEATGEKKSSLYAITLNQLGLACVQLHVISEAAEHFDEARSILEKEHGLFHPDTLGVYNSLASTYDALGRWDDAIELLESVVIVREEKLGTADPVVDDEKKRLAELLKEAGKARRRQSRSLETLFDIHTQTDLIVTKNQLMACK